MKCAEPRCARRHAEPCSKNIVQYWISVDGNHICCRCEFHKLSDSARVASTWRQATLEECLVQEVLNS
jgi:hypothetical protein